MGVYAAIISSVIGTGVKLLGSSQGPNYPSPPQIIGLPVQKAKHQMQNYEARRMQESINAWKTRFPELFKGGEYEVNDIRRNQQGLLSPVVSGALKSAGLAMPKEGDQYGLSTDIGLSPITLAQRTSQAVSRQIALNPEWTSKISGGTLATMIANNYQNQNAYSQFIGANQAAQYSAGQQAAAYNTSALTSGLFGAGALGISAYYNDQRPDNPLDPNQQPPSDVSNPGYYIPSPGMSTPAYSQPYPSSSFTNNLFNAPPPTPTNYVSNNPLYDPYAYNNTTG